MRIELPVCKSSKELANAENICANTPSCTPLAKSMNISHYLLISHYKSQNRNSSLSLQHPFFTNLYVLVMNNFFFLQNSMIF